MKMNSKCQSAYFSVEQLIGKHLLSQQNNNFQQKRKSFKIESKDRGDLNYQLTKVVG